MSNELLAELNAYRANESKEAFKDWRKARHLPMLEAYRKTDPALNVKEPEYLGDEFEASEAELLAQKGRESADIARDEALVAPKVDVKIKGAKMLPPGEYPVKVESVKMDKKGNVKLTATVVKSAAYKELPRHEKSTVEKPFVVIHSFLDANPTMKRKEAVAALIEIGRQRDHWKQAADHWMDEALKRGA